VAERIDVLFGVEVSGDLRCVGWGSHPLQRGGDLMWRFVVVVVLLQLFIKTRQKRVNHTHRVLLVLLMFTQ